MGDQQNITQILAALAAARPGGFPGSVPASSPPVDATGYSLPAPDNTGKLDISGVRPVNTGSVNISDAIGKARGFAAEKGISYDPERGGPARDGETLRDPRSYRRSRSPSRSPATARRDAFRDNHNPYRDERRGDKRFGGDRGYMRGRSFSPRPAGRRSDGYSPPSARQYRDHTDHSPPERRTAGSDDNSDMFSIDSRLVGLVIGRQGETLRKIEADMGTRVQFLDCPEPHTRLCRITGDKTARDDTKHEINRLVHENAPTSRPVTGLTEWPARESSATQLDDNSLEITVPDRTVGLIIGRHGETIQDLQERSGCHVNIKDKAVIKNGLRPVKLTGPPRAMERARDLIMDIVDSDTRQNATPQQQPPREVRDHTYGPSDTSGGPGEKVTDSFLVPKDAVGMIIGKGGDAIKEMQAMTGCKVNILPPSGPDGEREVTLLGSRTAIDQATRSIVEKVEAVKHRAQTSRRDESFSDQYSNYQAQPYSQPPSTASQHQQQQQQPPAQAGAGDGSDPYARYGGYENYMAMWYAMANQQQYQQYQQYQQSGHDPSSRSEHPAPGLS